ncbi:peptidoglycan-binding domain-containing protein [Corticibacter populi]|uniref:peptidoglycan-binding domain-containing protein n=1 Tax=Corticibacter populi TaxID=1550736 RepID=UPI0010EB6960|nr:hypothetical protein [Corticibacter populi]RZS33283.1 hypothetical protein EV687_1605 [Corticibacter populi]
METFQAPNTGKRVWNLSRSVGWGYGYLVWDAKLVQYLLNVARTYYLDRHHTTLFDKPLVIDGKVGARTDEALRAFARRRGITRSPGVASRIQVSGGDPTSFRRYAFWLLLCCGCDVRDPGGNAGSYSASAFSFDLFDKPMPPKYPGVPPDLRSYLKARWEAGA